MEWNVNEDGFLLVISGAGNVYSPSDQFLGLAISTVELEYFLDRE